MLTRWIRFHRFEAHLLAINSYDLTCLKPNHGKCQNVGFFDENRVQFAGASDKKFYSDWIFFANLLLYPLSELLGVYILCCFLPSTIVISVHVVFVIDVYTIQFGY